MVVASAYCYGSTDLVKDQETSDGVPGEPGDAYSSHSSQLAGVPAHRSIKVFRLGATIFSTLFVINNVAGDPANVSDVPISSGVEGTKLFNVTDGGTTKSKGIPFYLKIATFDLQDFFGYGDSIDYSTGPKAPIIVPVRANERKPADYTFVDALVILLLFTDPPRLDNNQTYKEDDDPYK
jgi:hypothetical protein